MSSRSSLATKEVSDQSGLQDLVSKKLIIIKKKHRPVEQRQVGLCELATDQPGAHREFWDSLGYTVRKCLKSRVNTGGAGEISGFKMSPCSLREPTTGSKHPCRVVSNWNSA